MCGIVGYIGTKQALPILVDGLRCLEYRGYDSSGISVLGDSFFDCKAVGKIAQLEDRIEGVDIRGKIGLAHTRWATHGSPTEENAHPHCDCSGDIRVVHNGIIENYQELKDKLIKRGHKFISETDTEVIPHLLEEMYTGNLTETMHTILKLIRGTYGLVAVHAQEPDKLVIARCGSPLVIGVAEQEIIIASDVSAIINHTDQVIFLDDGEVGEVSGNDYKIFDLNSRPKNKNVQKVEWDVEQAGKAGFEHFMLKEIYEQPKTIEDSVRGRMKRSESMVKLGGLEDCLGELKKKKRIIITACGTAYHAGMVGEYMFEELAGMPVEVEYASEFRYREPVLEKSTAVMAISQSGETADTLAAIREAKKRGLLTLGIVNVVGSTIARETDAGVYNHIGPEIAVASTKAFTSQVVIMALMTVLLGRQRNMSARTAKEIITAIRRLPDQIKKILEQDKLIENIAQKYLNAKDFAFLGRKYNYPTALEGALKLKELSYVHSEGFPSGEMKHGSIAMIEESFPSIFIAPQDSVYEKNKSNIEEIKARGGPVIAITSEGNTDLAGKAYETIYIPETLEMLTPILATIPLQLFAYHFSNLKGLDVDKPRNLAKSVTVE